MSQDNQNFQPPSQEPENNQPESEVESVTPPPQQASRRVQPAWKTFTIQILRGTIGLLEATVAKLETAPPPGTAEAPSFWQKLQMSWSTVLGRIRAFLPANLSAKLSNTALTGIMAGVAIILIWTFSTVFVGKPPEVATAPPLEEPATVTTPSATEETPTPQVPETLPTQEVVPPATKEIPPPVEEVPPPTETTPPVEEVPPLPETTPPTPDVEPTPTPTPTFLLTPEQNLIAAIENQVAEISDRFAFGLIQSIQADFRTGDLTIRISDNWYTFEQEQQNQLAAEILQRSQELDFTHLEIVDSQNKLVARNPVVGTSMVIFKRHNKTE